MTPKMRVTWRADLALWEVWEQYAGGKPNRRHSLHRSEKAARAAARAQAAQDKKDAAKAKLDHVEKANRFRQSCGHSIYRN